MTDGHPLAQLPGPERSRGFWFANSLKNTGNVEDTFEFSVSGNLWDVTLPFPVTLGVGSSDAVTVFVTVPAGANDGEFDVSTITATSQGDGSTDSSTLTTTAMVEEYLVYLPVIARR